MEVELSFVDFMQTSLQAHGIFQEVWNARVSDLQECFGSGLLPEFDLVSIHLIKYNINRKI